MFLDVLGNATGYGMYLIAVSFFRELFGSGSVLNFQVIPDSFYSAGYENVGLFVLSPGAFIILGLIIWFQRTVTKYEEV